jgi:hypothetical protein
MSAKTEKYVGQGEKYVRWGKREKEKRRSRLARSRPNVNPSSLCPISPRIPTHLCLFTLQQQCNSRLDNHYIYSLPGYCHYREEIVIMLLWLQFISEFKVISVCRHIMASIKISNHRLFRFARISRHRSITLITIYFGIPAYLDQ